MHTPTFRNNPEIHTPLCNFFGILFCLLLMIGLPLDTWLRLVIWMAIGLLVYFFYGRKHSVLRRKEGTAA